jgi:hypothetical protein
VRDGLERRNPMADPNNGTVHVMEEEMIAAEQGVFEPKSGEAGKAEPDHENKMAPAPVNKASPRAKRKAK